jgi:hypothetical protein
MSHFLMLENWFMLMTNGGILDCIMKGWCLLYDLGHIEEKNIDQHKDWIEKACESLKMKLNE